MFEKYNVKKEFDLLSEDSDSYDFFMLEAILEAGYRPRVVMVEYNANFELTEARSILPPGEGEAWQRWQILISPAARGPRGRAGSPHIRCKKTAKENKL